MRDPDHSDARSAGLRAAVLAVSAIVVVPGLLLYGYVLAWFWPEATGYTCAADDVGCHRDSRHTVLWWALLVAWAGAATAQGVGWFRRYRAGRWWPWPVLAVGFIAAAVPVPSLLG